MPHKDPYPARALAIPRFNTDHEDYVMAEEVIKEIEQIA
jgi:hypothetical protein